MVRATAVVAVLFAFYACASSGVWVAPAPAAERAVGTGLGNEVVRKPEEDLTLIEDADVDEGFGEENEDEDDMLDQQVRMGRAPPEEDLTLTDDMEWDGGIEDDDYEDEFDEVMRMAGVEEDAEAKERM